MTIQLFVNNSKANWTKTKVIKIFLPPQMAGKQSHLGWRFDCW